MNTSLPLLLRRLRILPLSPASADPQKKLVFLSQLADLGYLVKNPDAYNDSLLPLYDEIIQELRQMRGGHVEYVPLFSNFPESIPDDLAYFVERLIGRAAQFCRKLVSGVTLDSGMVVPEWLFDLKKFGADPISQMQDPLLYQQALEKQQGRKRDRVMHWIELEFVSTEMAETRAREFVLNSLYTPTSIPEALRPDLSLLLESFPDLEVDPERVVFRETRTYLSHHFWRLGNHQQVKKWLGTPTDILRLLAAATDSDVSLAKPIRYPRLGRAQRRLILATLENCPQLEEDLNRYRGLWLKIAHGLHPGSCSRRFPRSDRAFQALRQGPIPTFNTRLEAAFARRDQESLAALLSSRPGLFGRRLHQALEVCPGLLKNFENIVDEIPVKNLLRMECYFRTIESAQKRTILTKGGRLRVLTNRPGRLQPQQQEQLVGVLRLALLRCISRSKESWSGKRVWIDPTLRSLTVPLHLRKASDGLLLLGRGSRLPLSEEPVLRLFVYWKESGKTTDLDLSVIRFDEAMEYNGHVSYTRLSGDGLVHSGDLQSAPLGAAEFIDARLDKLEDGYLAPLVYRYCGSNFGQMTCHSGWMLREDIDARIQTFDIQTVVNKFDLTGEAGYAIPFLVDLKTRTIIVVDLYVSGASLHNRVEGSVQDVAQLARAAIEMRDTMPNLYDLALLHVEGRGGQPSQLREQADISLGLRDCTYDFLARPIQWLQEFL